MKLDLKLTSNKGVAYGISWKNLVLIRITITGTTTQNIFVEKQEAWFFKRLLKRKKWYFKTVGWVTKDELDELSNFIEMKKNVSSKSNMG